MPLLSERKGDFVSYRDAFLPPHVVSIVYSLVLMTGCSTLLMAQQPVLQGKVTDRVTGLPIAGAGAFFYGGGYGFATTDSSGIYRFTSADIQSFGGALTGNLYVGASGYFEAPPAAVPDLGTQSILPVIRDFTLASGGTVVRGTVRNSSTGAPIAGAAVSFSRNPMSTFRGGGTTVSVSTAADGTYVIDSSNFNESGRSSGFSVNFGLTAPGYLGASRSVSFTAFPRTEDFNLTPAVSVVLQGKVTDRVTGLPIAGAGAFFYGGGYGYATTDSSGIYRFTSGDIISFGGALSGNLYMGVSGYFEAPPAVVPDLGAQSSLPVIRDFTLATGGTMVRGTVRNSSTSAPIAGAAVSFSRNPMSTFRGGGTTVSVTTAADGTYAIDSSYFNESGRSSGFSLALGLTAAGYLGASRSISFTAFPRTEDFNLTPPVTTPPPTASPLPDGYLNTPYKWNTVNCFIRSSCGVTVVRGLLPTGVLLNNNVLQGTPTQTGLYSFTLEYTTSSIPPLGLPSVKDVDYTLEIKGQPAPRGHVTVNRNTLHLALSSSNTPSSAQPIFVNTTSPGVIGWTISADSNGVLVSVNPVPTVQFEQTSIAGTVGSGQFYIQANFHSPPSTFPFTSIVTVQDTGGSSQQIVVTITNSTGAPPFGVLDTPADNSMVSGAVPGTGWALDDVEVQAVDIYRDPVVGEPPGKIYIGSAPFVPDARPDVANAFPNEPISYRAGWGLLVLTNLFPNSDGSAGRGNGSYRLLAYARNVENKATLLGAKRITVNNADSVLPFGTLDTPDPITPISGTYVNFGWALTPQPSKIPFDGSTITVYIDGQPVGHPVYNNFRSDVAAGFPGLANTNGAVGYYKFDSNTLTNGLHSISWTVFDDHGHGAGIGSRTFLVQNSGFTTSATEPELPPEASEHALHRAADGAWELEAAPMDRIGIDLTSLLNGLDSVEALPVGASVDQAHRFFYWQLTAQHGTHEVSVAPGVRLRVKIASEGVNALKH